VFYALCFNKGFNDYGYKSVESAIQMQDRMTKFIIFTDDSSKFNTNVLSSFAASKLEILRVLKPMDFYHNAKRKGKHDLNYAQIKAFIAALQHSIIHYPKSHVVIQDMDILWMTRNFMEVFDTRPFTVGIPARAEGQYAAVNCALILAHSSRLSEALAFFELTLHLYRHRPLTYYELQARAYGHSCCAQHVIQHGLEIVLEDNRQWAQNRDRMSYFTRKVQLNPSTSPDGYQQNASNYCLQSFPNITESFVFLALPVHQFIPTGSNTTNQVFTEAYALHYKGNLKNVNMAQDFSASMNFIQNKEFESMVNIVKRRQPNHTDEKCHHECCGVLCKIHEPTMHIGNCSVRPWFSPFDELIRRLRWPDTKNIDKVN
jgi:hypothetical protein